MSSSERRAGAALVLVAAVLAGCGAARLRQWDLVDQPLPCADADRLAYRTVTAMGYQVTDLTPAAEGGRGTIRARRAAAGETEAITVTIACTTAGVTLTASRDGLFADQLHTRRVFHNTFLEVRARAAAARQLEADLRAGRAPAGQQRHDLRVLVEPLRGPAGRLAFPFDPSRAGLLPVRIEVTNLSEQTYRVETDAVRLLRADRARVAPLSLADAAGRAAAIAGAGDALAAQAFAGGDLPPGAQHQGFLYFPLAEYGSARVLVTDLASGEREGVGVEFGP